jgi:hypothetical protein
MAFRKVGRRAASLRFADGRNRGFELLAGMKGNDTARGDRNFLTRFGIPARTLRFVAQLEVAEARQLHGLAALERKA